MSIFEEIVGLAGGSVYELQAAVYGFVGRGISVGRANSGQSLIITPSLTNQGKPVFRGDAMPKRR
jgi:hypothetical protein